LFCFVLFCFGQHKDFLQRQRFVTEPQRKMAAATQHNRDEKRGHIKMMTQKDDDDERNDEKKDTGKNMTTTEVNESLKASQRQPTTDDRN
jgi:hypothetical protein